MLRKRDDDDRDDRGDRGGPAATVPIVATARRGDRPPPSAP